MDLLNWTTTPHFWIAVAIPGLATTSIVWRRRRQFRMNASVLLIAIALTACSAYFDLRGILGLPADPWSLYALPFFPAVYLIAGRYRMPDPLFCYAGTFLTLFVTDLCFALTRAWVGLVPTGYGLIGIGGGGILDGLFVAPLLAALAAHLVRVGLHRGVPMRLFKSRLRPDQSDTEQGKDLSDP